MKTLLKISAFIAFFCISAGVIAQSTINIEVNITDNCGTAGSYTVYAWVYCTSTSTNYCINPPATVCTLCTTGNNTGLSFSCSVPLDANHKIYQVKIHAVKNGVSTCTGNGTSASSYTTDELYSQTIPVSVTLH